MVVYCEKCRHMNDKVPDLVQDGAAMCMDLPHFRGDKEFYQEVLSVRGQLQGIVNDAHLSQDGLTHGLATNHFETENIMVAVREARESLDSMWNHLVKLHPDFREKFGYLRDYPKGESSDG